MLTLEVPAGLAAECPQVLSISRSGTALDRGACPPLAPAAGSDALRCGLSMPAAVLAEPPDVAAPRM